MPNNLFYLGYLNTRHCSYITVVLTFELLLKTRHVATQNQARTGCSGEAEGVWWDPPTLWQGNEDHYCCTVAVHLLSVMFLLLPYLTLFEYWLWKQIMSETRLPGNVEGFFVVLCLILNCVQQRKRMVVPAALKIVRLKPTRKVSLLWSREISSCCRILFADADNVLQPICHELFLDSDELSTTDLLMRRIIRIWLLSQDKLCLSLKV